MVEKPDTEIQLCVIWLSHWLNMAGSILLAKAKEIRSLAERVITYGKNDTVHHRRLAYKVLGNRTIVKKVFDELAPGYMDRNGGYLRIMKNGYRRGDCAPMAVIEFVERSEKSAKSDNIKAKDLAE